MSMFKHVWHGTPAPLAAGFMVENSIEYHWACTVIGQDGM